MNTYFSKIENNILTILKNLELKNNKLLIKDNKNTEIFTFFKEFSTASRVLPNDKNYELINSLTEYIYQLYSKDPNIPINNDSKNITLPYNESYWTSSYWQLDDKNKTIRKEGEKRIAVAGEYFRKEIQKDVNSIDKSYLKVDLIHPRTGFSIEEEELENGFDIERKIKYRYIYGQNLLLDDYLFRVYFTFNPFFDILSDFLKALQDKFDNSGIPFEFKFIENKDSYQTLDTGVLYLSRKHTHLSFCIIREVYYEFKEKKENEVSFFRKDELMFTYQIDDGFAFAENPDDDRFGSFGKYASLLVAKAIVENLDKLTFTNPLENDVTVIIKTIEKQNHIKIENFYKNPHSEIYYNVRFLKRETREDEKKLLLRFPKGQTTTNKKFYEIGENDDNKHLFTAIKIANNICKEAIWTEGYCNWVSCSGNLLRDNEISGYQFGLLDDGLPTGRLGVSLFLSYIFYYYTDLSIKRTANAAIKNLEDINNQTEEQKAILKIIKANLKGKISKNNGSNNVPINYSYFFKSATPTGFINNFNGIIKTTQWRDNSIANLAQTPPIEDEEKELGNKIIDEYFNVERPFGNAFGNDEFNPTLIGGYSMLGYFFLRLYDSENIPLLPFKFVEESQSNSQPLFQVSTVSNFQK